MSFTYSRRMTQKTATTAAAHRPPMPTGPSVTVCWLRVDVAVDRAEKLRGGAETTAESGFPPPPINDATDGGVAPIVASGAAAAAAMASHSSLAVATTAVEARDV
jgi:hypothetical protein